MPPYNTIIAKKKKMPLEQTVIEPWKADTTPEILLQKNQGEIWLVRYKL